MAVEGTLFGTRDIAERIKVTQVTIRTWFAQGFRPNGWDIQQVGHSFVCLVPVDKAGKMYYKKEGELTEFPVEMRPDLMKLNPDIFPKTPDWDGVAAGSWKKTKKSK